MAVKNKRTFLSENEANKKTIDQRLRNKLKESYEEALTEADEDEDFEDEDISIDDEESGDDLGLTGEEGEDLDDLGDDEEFGIDADLSPDQSEFVDDEVDRLLEPEVEELDLEEADDFDFDDTDEDGLGIEDDVDDLDIEGSGDFEDESEDFAADGAIDDEELQTIIDGEDTYDELGSTLKDIAIEEFPGDGMDGEFDEQGLEDEIDVEAGIDAELEEALMAEGFDSSFEDDTISQPMSEARRLRNKRRGIKEDVKLQSELKSLDFDEENEPSEVKKGTYSKVSDSAKGGASKGKVTHGKGLTQTMKSQTMKKESVEKMQQESIKKSKMLVKAAKQINGLQDRVKQLQLENYRLLKANGILAVTGEKLDKASRASISESFTKCKNKVQVDQLYEKVVKIIKQKSRPSLNETVSKSKKSSVKTTNLLVENEQKLSFDDQRKHMLMGLKTSDDVYFSF